MQELVGKTIKKVFIGFGSYNSFLKFIVTDELNTEKELVYAVCGDCCSEAWFSEVIGVSNLREDAKASKVESVTELYLGETYLRSRQEVDEVRGFILHLQRGRQLLVMFRTSSNGYYGGWCNLVDDKVTYGYSTEPKDLEYTELKDDFYEGINKPEQN